MKGAATAVHNRDFGAVQLYQHVINTRTSQGRHDMFHGAYPGAVVLQGGAAGVSTT